MTANSAESVASERKSLQGHDASDRSDDAFDWDGDRRLAAIVLIVRCPPLPLLVAPEGNLGPLVPCLIVHETDGSSAAVTETWPRRRASSGGEYQAGELLWMNPWMSGLAGRAPPRR